MNNPSDYFETRKRDDDTTYVTLKDDRPEWLHDAVQAAHDGELPNDWRHETCRAIVDALADGADRDEIADSLVDVYTSDLLAWLSGYRATYCDDAMEDGMASPSSTLEERIRLGQYLAIERMVHILADAIEENAEEDETDDE